MNTIIKIGAVVLSGFLLLSIGLAQMEYRYFVRQSSKMIALQEDYQNHIAAIDKVLAEYNHLKELVEQTDLVSADEKKKRNPWITIDTDSEICFPETPMYSSDDEPDEEGSFPIINRELEYLKQSAIEYIRKQNLETLLNRLGQDEWQDYQQILESKAKPKASGQKKRRVKSAKKQPKNSRVKRLPRICISNGRSAVQNVG